MSWIPAHGSAASLLSGGSSLYGSAEDRQLHEVRRLKRELGDARDQVMSLSTQLSTNVSTCYFYLSILVVTDKNNIKVNNCELRAYLAL